jgi:hypothetical protein
MVTLKQLQKEFGAKLGKRQIIQLWIEKPEAQKYINKALNNKLTDADIDYIFKIGNWKSDKYPGLYYLTTIYIHPLTYLRGVLEKYQAINS